VPIYLVETYLTIGTAGVRTARERRVSTAAGALDRAGTHVRFAGSLYVPADEICYFAFDARSGDVAELAARQAGLDPLRVVRAVPSGFSFDGVETAPRAGTSGVSDPGERRDN
jgi:hypothetical protein